MTARIRRALRRLRPGALDRRLAPHLPSDLDVRIGVVG